MFNSLQAQDQFERKLVDETDDNALLSSVRLLMASLAPRLEPQGRSTEQRQAATVALKNRAVAEQRIGETATGDKGFGAGELFEAQDQTGRRVPVPPAKRKRTAAARKPTNPAHVK